MSESPVVVFDGVSRWYGEVIALNSTSFSIGAGVTGLLGPNGAGKTTILRLLTGQIRPSLGSVRVYGQDPASSPEIFTKIGYCPDGEALYDGMTGFSFLEFSGRLAGLGADEARRRAGVALERMALDREGARRVGGYSKGMRQRLKLAQAFIHDPEMLVLDEPLSGMDPVGRHKAIELVRYWGEKGGIVIVSSHILHEVEAMTRRILLVQSGRIRAEGEVWEIRELIENRPHHISIRCDEPRSVASELLTWDSVDGVGFERAAEALVVETRRPDEFYTKLPAFLLERGIAAEEITAADAGLDAVFDYLTGQRHG